MIIRANSAIVILAASMLVGAAALTAQTAKPTPAPKPAAAAAPTRPPAPEEYSGTTVNMNPGAGTALSIQVLRWSADADRDKVIAALTAAPAPAAAAPAPAAAPAAAPAPAAAAPAAPATPAPAAPAPAAAADKGQADLTKTLQESPTVGYIWTGGSLGYSLKYAHRQTQPDGSEQVVVVTDRPLGSWERTGPWKASAGAAAERPFTVIEMHVNKAGDGQGKMSLSAPFAVDDKTKALGLVNYGSATVLLKDVKHKPAPREN
jgi:hypothetical protein